VREGQPLHRIVLVESQLEEMLETLVTDSSRVAIFRLGVHRRSDGLDLLAHDPRLGQARESRAATRSAHRALVALSRTPHEQVTAWMAEARTQAAIHWAGFVAIGIDEGRDRLAGGLLGPDGATWPLDAVALIGPGMSEIVLPSYHATGRRNVGAEPLAEGRWTRSMAALGARAWRRLTGLSYGIIGCGRSGSLLAQSLAGLGVSQMILVDPDAVEEHNLGEMVEVDAGDVGHGKAEVVAAHLAKAYPWVHVQPIVASVTANRVLAPLLGCDVLACAADNDGARLAGAALSTLYLKPLLDVGTAILGIGPELHMGSDVRLLVPGDGCLLCLGGLARPQEAQAMLTSASGEQQFREGRNWRTERVGSLRSLNLTATGIGMRLLEDFMAGRRTRSTWLRLEFNREGVPAITEMLAARRPDCPLCRRTGHGDQALTEIMPQLLASSALR